VLGVAMPAYSEARLISIDLTDIKPAEYRADVVVLLLDGTTPSRVLIVEVQLGIAPKKRLSWPAYTMGARAKHGCPVGLLVVAPDPSVAAWCAEPIETGIPGFVLRPPVLGREAVPVVIDPVEAARRPELGVLSAMAHGQGEQGAAIGAAVLPAVARLEDERARFYGDLVLTSLNEAARKALEAQMKGYEYQSEFAKKYVAQGREQGLEQGREQGLEQGREQGLEQGRELEYERLYQRRLGRTLSDAERATLRERWGRLGADRLGDVLLDSSAEALAVWLADPEAR
jgi:hypothetical protein